MWYLSSTEAVQNILAYQPDARFIVMVRNPVEMAPALYAEMLVSGHENVNFTKKSAARVGNYRRSVGRDGDFFTATWVSSEPNSSVLAIVLDDIIVDPRGEYLRVLRFLGLKGDGRLDFAIYNKAKKTRWPSLTLSYI